MEFPIRCFTCGSLIGHLYEKYTDIKKNKSEEEILNELGVERYCCRRMFVSHVEIMKELSKYSKG